MHYHVMVDVGWVQFVH